VQRELTGVAGQASGDVQQAVAQPLGLADAVLAVEAQQLGPDGQMVRAERGFQPRLVRRGCGERQVRETDALERADAVFDDGVGAVASLQDGEVGVGLVGDEALKAVPVDVREAQLSAEVRALAPDDQPQARRPRVEREVRSAPTARQQRRARPRRQTRAVRPDFYLLDAGTSHHLQGEPSERESGGLDNQQPSLLRRTFQPATHAATRGSNGASILVLEYRI
jgi:hypothetical protein